MSPLKFRSKVIDGLLDGYESPQPPQVTVGRPSKKNLALTGRHFISSCKASQSQTVSCVPTEQLTNANRPVIVVKLVVALRCVLHHALNDSILLSITKSQAT